MFGCLISISRDLFTIKFLRLLLSLSFDWEDNLELKKPRRRAEDNVYQKMILYFASESRDTLKSFSSFLTVKTILKLNMERSVKFGI